RKELNLQPYFNRDKRVDLVVDAVRGIMKQEATESFVKSRDQFLKFARNINTSKTEELLGNDFLGQMFLKVGNDDFTKALLKTGTKDKPGRADLLQQFSDKEQEHVLETIAGYTPQKFYDLMAGVGKLLN